MSKSFIDFKSVKSAIRMDQVLAHYGLTEQFKRSGDSLSGPCPIHKGSNPTQFRVSLSKNIWNCFSECKTGGNVLDFIARMEGETIHAAALKAIDWFHLDRGAMSLTSPKEAEKPQETRAHPKVIQPKVAAKVPQALPETAVTNKALKFRLEKLEREHPYLIERGLTLQTVIDFGIGFCAKGMMAEHIAIPIHTLDGNVVAYAGRYPGEPPEGTPKYKLPQGFRKSLELFNADKAFKAPKDMPLVIVEGFFDCMKLHQHGYRRVVALMGSTMSEAQEELIKSQIQGNDQVIVMLDEDEAGKAARETIAVRLAIWSFVKIHTFDEEGFQPADLTAEDVAQMSGGNLT
jgi:DNA primase